MTSIDLTQPMIPQSSFAGSKAVTDCGVSTDEGQLLANLISQSEGLSVEIGSWIGISSVYLAKGLMARGGGQLHCIDPHSGSTLHRSSSKLTKSMGLDDTEALWRENMARAGIEHMVTLHRAKSEDVFPTWSYGPIGFLFIDGDHRYPAVSRDFIGWAPHLAEGATLVFHDTDYVGPTRTIEEMVIPSGIFTEREGSRRVRIFKKRKSGSGEFDAAV